MQSHRHRPWPLPQRPWVVAMRWHDLLFLHWPLPADRLRPLIPAGLEIDIFEGSAWIGVIPFTMTGVRARGTPSLPWISSFPELNVRTYVKAAGKSGVWFFSLDAANPIAVRFARAFFYLPYLDAKMRVRKEKGSIQYQSFRRDSKSGPAAFVGSYHPAGSVERKSGDARARWLTDRYALFSADRSGGLFLGEIHHEPWALQTAEAEVQTNSMLEPLGLKLPDAEPLLHFAEFQEVVAWWPVRI